jgi:hypothetical protein
MAGDDQNGVNGAAKGDYYNSGSSELATETALTMTRLEKVSPSLH